MKKWLFDRGVKLLARFALLSDVNPTDLEKVKFTIWAVAHIAPVVFLLDWIKAWFQDNGQFGLFMCIALIVNMIVGVWYHIKYKSFNYKEFLLKNAEMMGVMTIVYVMLEMLRYTAGDNLAGEVFKVFIQILTLLYPTSKVLKNMFIISKGRHPPKVIMYRLYNFEKYGDLEGFFKTKSDGVNNDEDGFKEHIDELLNTHTDE